MKKGNWLEGLLQNIFGTRVIQGGKNMPTEDYTEGGLFNRQPTPQGYVSPLPDEEYLAGRRGAYVAQGGISPIPAQGYAAPPLATPSPTPTPTPMTTGWQKDPYEFPAGDKPPIPDEHRPLISSFSQDYPAPYLAPIVASVFAQETGGYNYLPPAGTSWEEARRVRFVGESGEVGPLQIIPKWYWKDAGFPDEETYSQNLYDSNFALNEAARILNKNYYIYGEDWRKALNAWNKNPSYPDEILGRIGLPSK